MATAQNPFKKIRRSIIALRLRLHRHQDMSFWAELARKPGWREASRTRIEQFLGELKALESKLHSVEAKNRREVKKKRTAQIDLNNILWRLLRVKKKLETGFAKMGGDLGVRYSMTRGIDYVDRFFQDDTKQLIRSLIRLKKQIAQKAAKELSGSQPAGEAPTPPKLKVFEGGVGAGMLLKQLKNEFGDDIETHGASLTQPQRKLTGVDVLFHGNIVSPKHYWHSEGHKYEYIVYPKAAAMDIRQFEELERLVLRKLDPTIGHARVEVEPTTTKRFEDWAPRIARYGFTAEGIFAQKKAGTRLVGLRIVPKLGADTRQPAKRQAQ